MRSCLNVKADLNPIIKISYKLYHGNAILKLFLIVLNMPISFLKIPGDLAKKVLVTTFFKFLSCPWLRLKETDMVQTHFIIGTINGPDI